LPVGGKFFRAKDALSPRIARATQKGASRDVSERYSLDKESNWLSET
jgi:hypothetical protein